MIDRKSRSRSYRWHRFQIRLLKALNRVPLKENQKIYILTLLIGGLCGLAAVLFHHLLDLLQNSMIYAAAAVSGWQRIPLVILIPTLGGLIAGAGLFFFAPEARGSGIPQVKAAFYLDHGRIPARVVPGKMFLSAFNIGTGASLGREGPTVQICAAIASLLGRMFTISRRKLQGLVPVGAAAGLAAAFNTPIAAVTFTLEEILGESTAKPLGSIVIASVIAAVIERSILGEGALFKVPAYRLNSAVELLFYALLGLAAGLAAVAFNRGLIGLRARFLRQRKAPQWATPAIGGFILGFLGLVALLLTGSASIFGVGYGQLSVALLGSMPIQALVILAVFKLAATVVSYASGSSGGIFGPSLYLGGMVGGAIGILAQFVLGNPLIQPGAFALVGMGAAFAGIVRAPVTSIVIIFEMTDNYSIILPLMVANILSYVLASRLSPAPIYDALLLQDGIHLPHLQHHITSQINVGEAMSQDLATVDAKLSAEEAFTYVQSLPVQNQSYPLVDEAGGLVGMLTFGDLKRALSNGRGKRSLTDLVDKHILHAHLDHTLDYVMLKLGRHDISQMPVVSRKDPSRLLGMINMDDVVKAMSLRVEQAEEGEASVKPAVL